MDNMRSNMTAQLTAQGEALAAVRASFDSLASNTSDSLAALRKDVEGVASTAIPILQAATNSAAAEVGELRGGLQSLNASVLATGTSLEQLGAEVAILTSTPAAVAALDKAMKDLATKDAELEARAEAQAKSLADVKKAAEDKAAELEAATSVLSNQISAAAQAVDSEASSLEGALAGLQSKVSDAALDVASVSSKVTAAAKAVDVEASSLEEALTGLVGALEALGRKADRADKLASGAEGVLHRLGEGVKLEDTVGRIVAKLELLEHADEDAGGEVKEGASLREALGIVRSRLDDVAAAAGMLGAELGPGGQEDWDVVAALTLVKERLDQLGAKDSSLAERLDRLENPRHRRRRGF